MSPQYTSMHPSLNNNHKLPKVQHPEDSRFRSIDRMLARAYINVLRKRKMTHQQGGYYTPRMDLCNDSDKQHVTAMLEVPGMKPQQLSVRIEGARLVIEGERTGPHLHMSDPTSYQTVPTQVETPAPPALYPVQELKYGKFRREIELPVGVNASDIRSSLVEGMLTLQWPRSPHVAASIPPVSNPPTPTTSLPSSPISFPATSNPST